MPALAVWHSMWRDKALWAKGVKSGLMLKQRIGMIGAGQMATALGRGFVEAELVAAGELLAADPVAEARERFHETTGGIALDDNRAVVNQADVVFLAVKPHQLAAVASSLKGKVAAEKLVVSVAAGVRLDRLAEMFGAGVRMIRVMPNTPCLVGRGACAFSRGKTATAADAELVEQLLGAVSTVVEVEEKLLDAVTGLSGSGPAFVYTIIEALSDGGVRMGLPRAVATKLAAQTVAGAAEMVLESGEHTGLLKDRVCSPGGTTIAGIEALESGGVRAALMAAVEAAAKRSVELANS